MDRPRIRGGRLPFDRRIDPGHLFWRAAQKFLRQANAPGACCFGQFQAACGSSFLQRFEQDHLHINVVAEFVFDEPRERIELLLRDIPNNLLKVTGQCLAWLSIFLDVRQQESSRFGAGDGDRYIRQRLCVLFVPGLLSDTRYYRLRQQLISQSHANGIDQMSIIRGSAVPQREQRGDVFELGVLTDRICGGALDEGVRIVQPSLSQSAFLFRPVRGF